MAEFYEKLKRARAYELETGVQLEHIERLHRIAARAAAFRNEPAADVVEKIAALERELNAQIDKTADAKREALKYISSLIGEERAVMESYFFLGKDWARIAIDLSMSERRVFLLRKSALDKLSRLFGDEPGSRADRYTLSEKGRRKNKSGPEAENNEDLRVLSG